MKKLLIIILLAAGGLFVFFQAKKDQSAENTPAPQSAPGQEVEVVVSDLNIPWDVDFLPSGEVLITERPGNLLVITGTERKVIKISGVVHTAEGGLLGIAVHPRFSENHWIYLYLTSTEGGRTTNRVERYVLSVADSAVSERKVIISGILGSAVHDGGQLEFSPDNFLFITTGDAGDERLAQDKTSLNGKILRVQDDGSIPKDNPFGSAVYSYGHRNPQGLAWDSEGRLWATEHGPSGTETGNDELNLIEKGKNYGWPVIRGSQTRQGMETPVIESGRNETWAPAGLAFWEGRLYFAGLRGQALYAYDPGRAELKKFWAGRYGRLRAVKRGPGGLYVTTSNRDGRGNARSGGDKLLLIKDSGILK